MRFSYSYKTSDGVRHEDRIEAESREAAFALLRQRGIKAIKVVSLSGSKANGEEKIITRKRFVVAALVLGVLGGIVAEIAISHADFRDQRIKELEREGARILAAYDAKAKETGLDDIRNPELVANPSNRTEIIRRVRVGYEALNSARLESRTVFRDVYQQIPVESAKLREGAQSAYLALMDGLDVRESRLANDEKVFRLLDENRGKWKSTRGVMVFSDSAFADRLGLLVRDLSFTGR